MYQACVPLTKNWKNFYTYIIISLSYYQYLPFSCWSFLQGDHVRSFSSSSSVSFLSENSNVGLKMWEWNMVVINIYMFITCRYHTKKSHFILLFFCMCTVACFHNDFISSKEIFIFSSQENVSSSNFHFIICSIQLRKPANAIPKIVTNGFQCLQNSCDSALQWGLFLFARVR